MEAWRDWSRRQKIVIPKYHRGSFFLQAQTDPSFLLTEGTRQVKNFPEGEKRHEKNTCKDRKGGDTPREGMCDQDMLRGRKEKRRWLSLLERTQKS
jgi:hypothetical protein